MTHDESERLPAIHCDRLPRHPRGLVAREERRDLRDFLRRAVTAAGDALENALVERGILLPVDVPQPALEENRSWRDAIHADALARQRQGLRLRVLHDRGLDRAVGR